MPNLHAISGYGPTASVPEVNRRPGAWLILISGPGDTTNPGLLNRMVCRIQRSVETLGSVMAEEERSNVPETL